MIAYVIPTRDRPDELATTLRALGDLPPHDAEVIVIDNASAVPPSIPLVLPSGLPVRLVQSPANIGAAARNLGVHAADPRRTWIVMLDDDSHPLTPGLLDALADQPDDVAAVQAEIWLTPPDESPQPKRESGGLPEVFIGCGVAIRRDAFLAVGGYDPTFDYYAEEYDLAARLMLRGGRIAFDPRFQIHHRKVTRQRSMDRILRRLVRNNAWVIRRYAPAADRAAETRRTITRYARIALKERAELGYLAGLTDLCRTLHRQPRREMPAPIWARFTGAAACAEALHSAHARAPFHTAAIVAPGKNAHIIAATLRAMGITIDSDATAADVRVIGTLSPGPMLDAMDALAATPGPPLIAPWSPPRVPPRSAWRSASEYPHAPRGDKQIALRPLASRP